MLFRNIRYQKERKHASGRFIALLILTLLAFILSGQGDGKIAEEALLAGFVLLVLTLFSILHFYFISIFPSKAVALRKHLLIFIDFTVLTYFIVSFGEYGLFLFPFYILIVMYSGLSLGVYFFYSSIVIATISWIALFTYSPYWKAHSDIIVTFAMTTFLIPLFYLKTIIRIDEESMELNQTLNEVDYDETCDALTGIANRKKYKETIMELINKKEPFVLLFIDLNKFKAINEKHGDHVGNEVLKEVARRLSENIDEDDFLARLGGDEFAIVTKRKKIHIKKFLDKLERNVIGRHKVGKIIVPIELDIGVSFYPDDSRIAMMLSKYADEAMCRAKKDPDRYHYFYHEIAKRQ